MGPEAVVEEIRERIDLVDLISQYVQLKQSGRNWKGLCPFHPEKTPSFNVNRESRFWKCFGCGAGGDVFSFVMRQENVGFPDAVRLLAERLGLSWEPAHARPQERDEREEVLRANALALEWFTQSLQGEAGRPARAYLESRGLDADTIARFRLGYAPPGWDGLLNHLARRGIGSDPAVRAGLAKRSEQGGHYDVFRNRVIFPISDVVGKVIGFGGRALDPGDPAKYLNSPETLVFRKGRTVYGLDMARRAIADAGCAIVVEGYMDVIALAQHGFENCVATLGTALTDQHARLLSRYTLEIILIYDADAAGLAAVLRSAAAFEECPAAVKVVSLPEGKDPDNVVRDWGPAGFRELLDTRIGLVEHRLRMVFSGHESEGPEGLTRAAREAVDVLAEVGGVRRADLLRWAAHEWARGDVRAAPRLERLLLQEVERRAAENASVGRDEWQSVLVARGLPRPLARPEGRWLSSREWMAQRSIHQQRLAPLRRDALTAQWAGLTPDSPHSPVSPEFIGDALARAAAPFPPGALRLERRMLTAMLQRPDLAAELLRRLRPQDLLLPIHREIASAVGGAEADAASLGSARERLAKDEAVFAAAIEIAVADEGYDLSNLDDDLAYLREARLIGDCALRLYRTSEAPLQALHQDESLADIETQVRERLAAGTLAPDDPLYLRYIEIRRHLHGTGELSPWDLE